MVKTSEDSYSLKMTCRDTEAGAKATLESKDIGLTIMKYCDDVARMGGGSYSSFDGCITMEDEAQDAMRSK